MYSFVLNMSMFKNDLFFQNTQLQLRVECNSCQNIVGGLEMKLETTNDEDFLVGMLKVHIYLITCVIKRVF